MSGMAWRRVILCHAISVFGSALMSVKVILNADIFNNKPLLAIIMPDQHYM